LMLFIHRFVRFLTLIALLMPGKAQAHGGEASIVLLLPTGYYLLGAALAVALSFLLLAILPDRVVARLGTLRLNLGRWPVLPHAVTSGVAFVLLVVLVLAGFIGTRDPVENPLPLVIWTLWWVCFTVLQALVGPLWPHLNPWTGPLALIRRALGTALRSKPRLTLPLAVGYLIALAQFSLFAWFELIDLAPSDPDRLALAICVYWVFNLAGALLFSEREWLDHAEPFSIFFGLIGRLSSLDRRAAGAGHVRLGLVWPGRGLVDVAGLPIAGVLFVLATLSTVAFDGLSRTFVWLAAIDINPLEFPGRSVLSVSGTLGLIGVFAAQSLLFFGAVALGAVLAGRGDQWRQASGRLVYSIVPIALAFQSAHYLTAVLVDGQNALIALSDPFSLGWNLLGTAHWHTTTSFLNTLAGVTWIFNLETAFIVLGHVTGIVMAHLIAIRVFGHARSAMVSQIPLAVLMVAYTAFGLWLLATPRI